MPTVEHYRDLLRLNFSDRSWLIGFPVLAAARATTRTLCELGARPCFVVSASPGTGPGPAPEHAPRQHVLGLAGEEMMTGIHRALDALAAVPPEIRADVDAWDPRGEARSIGTIFDDGRPVAGRRKYGARRPTWMALEDKIAVERLWEVLDVPRAPHRVVPIDRSLLLGAHTDLDRGLGTIWAGDNRDGWHGGASRLRWVRDREDATDAADFLSQHCDRVRVMPFLEGIPCSIHGIVFPDHVIALRPCEMLVSRRTDRPGLVYAAAGTFWDPPRADRGAMRALAQTVGAHLRDTLGYRGAFTIDGILSEEGFVPTELNPRFGAALGEVANALPDLPLMLLNLALVEGEDLDWRPRALEVLLLDAADCSRAGRIGVTTAQQREGSDDAHFVHDGAWRLAREGEEPHAKAFVGPAVAGTYAGARFVAEHTPVGPSLAGRATALLNALEAHWGLGLPPLAPPVDVRRAVTDRGEEPR